MVKIIDKTGIKRIQETSCPIFIILILCLVTYKKHIAALLTKTLRDVEIDPLAIMSNANLLSTDQQDEAYYGISNLALMFRTIIETYHEMPLITTLANHCEFIDFDYLRTINRELADQIDFERTAIAHGCETLTFAQAGLCSYPSARTAAAAAFDPDFMTTHSNEAGMMAAICDELDTLCHVILEKPFCGQGASMHCGLILSRWLYCLLGNLSEEVMEDNLSEEDFPKIAASPQVPKNELN